MLHMILCRPDMAGVGDGVEVIGDNVDVYVVFLKTLSRERLCDHLGIINLVANLT